LVQRTTTVPSLDQAVNIKFPDPASTSTGTFRSTVSPSSTPGSTA
jgi:hypothetical protein